MFGPWTAVVILAGSFLLTLWVKRWITRYLQELSMRLVGDPDVALVVYFVIVLPGVVIHELSHWLAAKLLGVRVSRPSLGPKRQGRSRRVSLGSVRVGKVDPLRASLIGMAPLFGGTLVILLVGALVLDMEQVGRATSLAAASGRSLEGVLAELERLVHIPDFWFWLYFIFAVSNAMLPSYSDMETVRPVLIFLAIVIALILILTGVPAIPEQVVVGVSRVASYLASVFVLTLAVDAVFMIVIGLLVWLVRALQDR